MDWIKMLQDLLKEDPRLKDDVQEAFFNILYKHKVNQFAEMFGELGKHLPFELILKLNNIADFPMNEIDYTFGVRGFDIWYKETYGMSVGEVLP
ncbi:MAG: hypothetical protein FVQ82_16995 [Planctomycetes bacterium]|nr:hypothetical protein [Planctomycetota bacterium]